MLGAGSFFDLTGYAWASLFSETAYVWEALRNLGQYLDDLTGDCPARAGIADGVPVGGHLVLHRGEVLPAGECCIENFATSRGGPTVRRNGVLLEGASVIMAGAVLQGKRIRIGRGVVIEAGALIREPAIIGDGSEVRQGAYLRGYCLVGCRCVVGHATEVKHSIFLDEAKAGHFAYVGDSILGGGVNLGAGTKLANFRFLPGQVMIRTPEGQIPSGLNKLGAVLGDRVQTGCNAVTSPGAMVGADTLIMPNTTVPSGYHQGKSVLR